MEIIKLIEKNLKILFRSKVSTFVTVIGPLIIILLAGLAFNNSSDYNIKVGTYSDVYSSTADLFIDQLSEEFDLNKIQTEEECIENVKSRGYHSCIVIQKDLEIGKTDQNKIDIYLDNTKVNIASYIEQKIYDSLQNSSTSISGDLTTNLVDTIKLTRQEVDKNKEAVLAEKIKVEEMKVKLSKAEDLLQTSNLDFDLGNLGITELENHASNGKADYDKAKTLSTDSIEDYEDSITVIEEINVSDSGVRSEVSDAKDNLVDLKVTLSEVKNNATSIDKIAGIASGLKSSLEGVETNLKSARTNKDGSVKEIQETKTNLQATSDRLTAFELSFSKIGDKINSNEILDAEGIIKPVVINKQPITTGSKLNYLFPSLIVLVIMFISILMSSSQVTQERVSRASLRVSMTPLNFSKQLAATFFSIMIILLFQILLILVIVQLVFGIQITATAYHTASVLIMTGVFFTVLGITLGHLFKSEQATLLGSAVCASVFFVLSDLILPIESMPKYMITIISHTPFVISTDSLRKVMFFGTPIQNTAYKILLIYIFTIVFLLIVINFLIRMYKKMQTKRAYS